MIARVLPDCTSCIGMANDQYSGAEMNSVLEGCGSKHRLYNANCVMKQVQSEDLCTNDMQKGDECRIDISHPSLAAESECSNRVMDGTAILLATNDRRSRGCNKKRLPANDTKSCQSSSNGALTSDKVLGCYTSPNTVVIEHGLLDPCGNIASSSNITWVDSICSNRIDGPVGSDSDDYPATLVLGKSYQGTNKTNNVLAVCNTSSTNSCRSEEILQMKKDRDDQLENELKLNSECCTMDVKAAEMSRIFTQVKSDICSRNTNTMDVKIAGLSRLFTQMKSDVCSRNTNNDVLVDCNSCNTCLHWSADSICMVDNEEKVKETLEYDKAYSADQVVTSKVCSHTNRVQTAIESSWSTLSWVDTGSSCGDMNDDHEYDQMVNRDVKTITQSLGNVCFSTNDCSNSVLAVCSSYSASRCPTATSYCNKDIDEMEVNRKEQAYAWAVSAKQCCYGQMRTARSSGTSSCRSATKHCNGVGVVVLAVVDHLLASFGDATSGRATLIAQVLTGIDPTVPTTHWLECNSSGVRCTCLCICQCGGHRDAAS